MAHVDLSLIQDCDKPCSSICNCRNMPECAGPIEKAMQLHLSTQLELCQQLEAIADDLPKTIDHQNLLIVARKILPTIKEAHRFEERRIFPHIQVEAEDKEALTQSLERLKFEHWEDESFAEELSHGLINFVSECEEPSSITLAYMLRGFFEGVRRHIAFEVEHILPLLRRQEAPAR
jgi:hemerythrin-like domain-containing protein